MCGPSGVGKSTIVRRFLAEDRESTFSVSCTTRAKREGEVEGKDYHFVDRATFEEMVEKDEFIEWERVHGRLYGTPKKPLADSLAKGVDVLLDIDVKGAIRVKEQCPAACLIFIEPPDHRALVERLSGRKEKEMELRLKRVEEELGQKYRFQYVIINDKLDTAFDEFKRIIEEVRRTNDGKDHC